MLTLEEASVSQHVGYLQPCASNSSECTGQSQLDLILSCRSARRRFGKPFYQSCSCDDDFADRLRCFNELMGGFHRFDAQSLQR
jgi:hypothetical protein